VAAAVLEEATPTATGSGEAVAPEELRGARKGAKLASRDELSQAERKSLRRKKKRIHARRSGEREQQQALKATLAPDSGAARKRDAQKTERELADAKRRGKVKSGPLASTSDRSGGDFSKSARFFKQLQDETAGGGARGAKRRRADADESARAGSKFKL
jgi:hypothetical protein